MEKRALDLQDSQGDRRVGIVDKMMRRKSILITSMVVSLLGS